MLDEHSIDRIAIPIGDQPARDADAICEGCGTRGTVGRAARGDATGTSEEHRYCADCWPEWSAFYRARWQEQARRASLAWRDGPRGAEPPPAWGMSFDSATWHGVIDVVKKLTEQAHSFKEPPTPEKLAQVADSIRGFACEKVGPMPVEVRSFLAEFGRTEPSI